MTPKNITRRSATLILTLALLATSTLTVSRGEAAQADNPFTPQLRSQLATDANAFASGAGPFLASHAEFLALIEALKQKGRISATELANAKAKAAALKQRAAALKRNLDGFSTKLQNANIASISFNNFVADRLRARNCARCDTTITRDGGARKLIQDGSSDLAAVQAEIDALIRELERLVGASLFIDNDRLTEAPARGLRATPVAFRTPAAEAPVFGRLLKCLVLGARLIIKTVQGTDTPDDRDQFAREC